MYHLKKDIELKCFKEKTTKHRKKVNERIVEELKFSLKHDKKQTCLGDRYNLIMERLDGLNISKSTL